MGLHAAAPIEQDLQGPRKKTKACTVKMYSLESKVGAAPVAKPEVREPRAIKPPKTFTVRNC